METNLLSNAIGSGAIFPIELTQTDKGTFTWARVDGDTGLIKNNLTSLLLHHFGEKLRCEDFATRLDECLEEPNTSVLVFTIKRFLVESILHWEPRVTIDQDKIEVYSYGPNIILSITVIVILTQSAINLEFNYNPQTQSLNVNV